MKKLILIIFTVFFASTILAGSNLKEEADAAKRRMMSRLSNIMVYKYENSIKENNIGLLECIKCDDNLKRIVRDENNDRMSIYKAIGADFKISAQEVGKKRAKKIRLMDCKNLFGDNPINCIPSSVAATIKSQCQAEWPTDYVMQKHCIDRQVEAWLEMN